MFSLFIMREDDFMYSVIEVAKFVISYCMKMGTPVSNLQLQKILYYLQVYCVRKGFHLFEEDIYAWQHGPVVPEAYYMFSGYGASKIQNVYETQIAESVQANILPIIEKLRTIAPWTLVSMTHKPGMPWDKVYNDKIDPTMLIDKRLLETDNTDLGVE